MPTEKIRCSLCQEWKDLGEFYHNRSKKFGRDSWCKDCRRKSERIRRDDTDLISTSIGYLSTLLLRYRSHIRQCESCLYTPPSVWDLCYHSDNEKQKGRSLHAIYTEHKWMRYSRLAWPWSLISKDVIYSVLADLRVALDSAKQSEDKEKHALELVLYRWKVESICPICHAIEHGELTDITRDRVTIGDVVLSEPQMGLSNGIVLKRVLRSEIDYYELCFSESPKWRRGDRFVEVEYERGNSLSPKLNIFSLDQLSTIIKGPAAKKEERWVKRC